MEREGAGCSSGEMHRQALSLDRRTRGSCEMLASVVTCVLIQLTSPATRPRPFAEQRPLDTLVYPLKDRVNALLCETQSYTTDLVGRGESRRAEQVKLKLKAEAEGRSSPPESKAKAEGLGLPEGDKRNSNSKTLSSVILHQAVQQESKAMESRRGRWKCSSVTSTSTTVGSHPLVHLLMELPHVLHDNLTLLR